MLEILIFLAIVFNVVVYLLSKEFRQFTKGIDSLPAVSIISGFLYGASAGVWAGLIVSIAYHIVRIRTLHYAPLTVLTNTLVGILASYMGFLGLFTSGIILLVVYHLLSAAVVSVLGGMKPGYFTFMILNFITTVVILYAAALFS